MAHRKAITCDENTPRELCSLLDMRQGAGAEGSDEDPNKNEMRSMISAANPYVKRCLTDILLDQGQIKSPRPWPLTPSSNLGLDNCSAPLSAPERGAFQIWTGSRQSLERETQRSDVDHGNLKE